MEPSTCSEDSRSSNCHQLSTDYHNLYRHKLNKLHTQSIILYVINNIIIIPRFLHSSEHCSCGYTVDALSLSIIIIKSSRLRACTNSLSIQSRLLSSSSSSLFQNASATVFLLSRKSPLVSTSAS